MFDLLLGIYAAIALPLWVATLIWALTHRPCAHKSIDPITRCCCRCGERLADLMMQRTQAVGLYPAAEKIEPGQIVYLGANGAVTATKRADPIGVVADAIEPGEIVFVSFTGKVFGS